MMLKNWFGFPCLEDYHKSRLSYKNIREDLESSLSLLGIDSIDMYWLHRDNLCIPTEEIVQWMNEFIKQGMISNWGVSNWTCKRINEANECAQKNNLDGIKASQIRWSLAKVTPGTDKDDTLVEMNSQEYYGYMKNQIPVFAFSSVNDGFGCSACLFAAGAAWLRRLGKGERRRADHRRAYADHPGQARQGESS